MTKELRDHFDLFNMSCSLNHTSNNFGFVRKPDWRKESWVGDESLAWSVNVRMIGRVNLSFEVIPSFKEVLCCLFGPIDIC